MYAIVDIETTGGNAGTGSITEIAIIIFINEFFILNKIVIKANYLD